jgi:PKD repeat protein
VTVFDSIHVALPPPVLCVNQSFNFGTITGNIINANWNFGDGTPDAIIINPSHTYSSPGNYIVTLIAETPDRCKDTVKIPISVRANPPLSFIVNPDSSCTGNNIQFSFPAGHDTATNYIWNFGISTVQSSTPTNQVFFISQTNIKRYLLFCNTTGGLFLRTFFLYRYSKSKSFTEG